MPDLRRSQSAARMQEPLILAGSCIRIRAADGPRRSFDLFEITPLPRLIEPGLQRPVEAQKPIPVFARHLWTQLFSSPAGALGANHTVTEPSAFFCMFLSVLSGPATARHSARAAERLWL
jgi:hypothetical protein